MFEIGQKVVCIDDSINPEFFFNIVRDFPNWVKKGIQYTIRDILYNDNIVAGILLQELKNEPIYIPLLKRNQEPAFATWRFKTIEHIHKLMDETASYEEFEKVLKETVEKYKIEPGVIINFLIGRG